jgi:uncharacterized protein
MLPALQRLRDLDLAPFLELNNRHSVELSALDASEFARLVGCAFHARATLQPLSFLLAFDATAPYASPNYLWFRARHSRFVYVDRIVIEPVGRGQGIARQHYLELFDAVRTAGHALVCAEVNSDPPNPASDAFHTALGFTETGRAVQPSRGKSVRYLERRLG